MILWLVVVAGVDTAVLGKIKKALALGVHQATGEAEAKRAMRSVIPYLKFALIPLTRCKTIDLQQS